MNLAGYKQKKVLVTGHTGFKGGWLSIWLDMLGAELAGIALDPPEKGVFNLSGIGGRMSDHRADIRDLDKILDIFAREQPEIVFHLAAQPLVLDSYRNPAETFAINTQGTAHVLEAIRQTPSVRAAVMVTTDKCYENTGDPWGYRENDRLGGHDPYSASKACAEIVSAAWRASYWQDDDAPLLATVRAGNVIGGGDWSEDRLVPDLIRAAEAGQSARIRNPDAVRPWQHVLEPLAGYLILGSRLLGGDRDCATVWNFGPALTDMQPVSALCDVLCTALGGGWGGDPGPHPKEEAVLRLDSSKAMQRLGWRPRWALPRALVAVADWHARQQRGEDARTLTLAQITEYEGDAA